MTTDAAVRKEIAELRAKGDDAAARERLKAWRTEKAGAGRRAPSAETATETETDEAWRAKLERYLLRLHQEANQSRAGRRAHRLSFLQCRQCDAIREATMSERASRAGT